MRFAFGLVLLWWVAGSCRGEVETFRFSRAGELDRVWGRPADEVPRKFFRGWLPALFTRTLVLEAPLPEGSKLEWIFTGDEGGFTVSIEPGKVRLTQRYYDSFGLAAARPPAGRMPERAWEESDIPWSGRLERLEVALDHKLGLQLSLNGRPASRQRCLLELRRHQLAWIPAPGSEAGEVRGRLVEPEAGAAVIHVNAARKHQSIFGFGGILSVPAYARLSDEGKSRWWHLIREYNLLLHREYPNGNRLKRDLSNFDELSSATPHYYGDNFPNGEISDFEYSRRIQEMGGKVLFEFWELPPWARRPYTGANGKVYPGSPVMDEYIRAMVGYCRIARTKTGRPPAVVGIQNEIVQADEVWHEMILKLREALDREGFADVKIHMPDHGRLRGGIDALRSIQRSEAAWKTVDYAATHVYDFQDFFDDPDGYDALIDEWKRLAGSKAFLSTELTVNRSPYQSRSYRTAFAQAQLYHKNMALMDASALIYCWTLLDVEQPSFAATRSLFTTDRSRGGMPIASSYQLRVFGAYSRRLREGMVRVEAAGGDPDVLVTAWEGRQERTVVMMNRATSPRRVEVSWPGSRFTEQETASPYEENSVRPAGSGPVRLEPGEVVTLTNVPLMR